MLSTNFTFIGTLSGMHKLVAAQFGVVYEALATALNRANKLFDAVCRQVFL
jgi:hypothetical protein